MNINVIKRIFQSVIDNNAVKLILLAVCFIFVSLLYGSIPFVTLPTLGQALWTAGFAQSYYNSGFGEIFASNIGYPQAAPIAFGLSGAFVTSFFVSIGVNSIDSYTIMNLFWIAVTFYGTYGLSKIFKLNFFEYLLVTLLWFSFSCLWNHLGYSMTSIGMILFPFYYYSFFKILQFRRSSFGDGLFFSCVTIVSVFMDGYTFIMFFFSVFLTSFLYCLFHKKKCRKVVFIAVPWGVFSFLLSYFLYMSYIGKSTFQPSSMNFFRAWGGDISYLLIPSKGVYWLWDLLGLSNERLGELNFGDASVWTTTFILPIILVTSFIIYKNSKKSNIIVFFCFISIFALYMSLGPSLKFFSVRPLSEGLMMPEEYASFPTGSELLYKYIPGVNVMRATYRWIVMFYFFQWLIVLYWLSLNDNAKIKKSLIIVTLIMINLPNMKVRLDGYLDYRKQAEDINNSIALELSEDVSKGDIVAFLPYNNDFLVNYLAPKLDIKTFNVGGDKNLSMARKMWPIYMKGFVFNSVDDGFYDRVLLLLLSKETNKVIFPYINFLSSAHDWKNKKIDNERFRYVLQRLEKLSIISVKKRDLYSVISLKDDPQLVREKENVFSEVKRRYCQTPICLKYSAYAPLPTQVAQFTGDSMLSSGKAGYLVFGPYSELERGKYELKVSGVLKSIIKSSLLPFISVDVFSNSRQETYYKHTFTEKEMNRGFTDTLFISNAVTDIEVRVLVGDGVIYELKGYSLDKNDSKTLLEKNK